MSVCTKKTVVDTSFIRGKGLGVVLDFVFIVAEHLIEPGTEKRVQLAGRLSLLTMMVGLTLSKTLDAPT